MIPSNANKVHNFDWKSSRKSNYKTIDTTSFVELFREVVSGKNLTFEVLHTTEFDKTWNAL